MKMTSYERGTSEHVFLLDWTDFKVAQEKSLIGTFFKKKNLFALRVAAQ